MTKDFLNWSGRKIGTHIKPGVIEVELEGKILQRKAVCTNCETRWSPHAEVGGQCAKGGNHDFTPSF